MHITIDCRMWGEKYGGIGRYTKEIVQYLITYKNGNSPFFIPLSHLKIYNPTKIKISNLFHAMPKFFH